MACGEVCGIRVGWVLGMELGWVWSIAHGEIALGGENY
jgi:hypothetical protein